MFRTHTSSPRKGRNTGRRSPLATTALIAAGLLFTGGAYAAFSTTTASAETSHAATAGNVEEGKKLFEANCASCHGLALEGSDVAPSLIGVGAASVDFQVGTGRMPLQNQGPQAPEKPVQFTEEQILALAEYVATTGPGPGIPDEDLLHADGDAANGAELFRINCAMCHNAAGAGGALTRGKDAPQVIGVDPKHVYEAMETGPQNMPVFNETNLSPSDKRDVITYLETLEETGSPGGLSLGSLGPVTEGLYAWTIILTLLVGTSVWLGGKAK